MSRFCCSVLCLGLWVLAGPNPVSGAKEDKNQCTIATKGDSTIAKACQEGGLKSARLAMKTMTKQAKDKGMKTECEDCHKRPDDGNFALTSDAVEKFKKMAALVK